jgi:hypothetical protein
MTTGIRRGPASSYLYRTPAKSDPTKYRAPIPPPVEGPDFVTSKLAHAFERAVNKCTGSKFDAAEMIINELISHGICLRVGRKKNEEKS